MRILLKLGDKGCHYISNSLDIRIKSAPEYNKEILNDNQIVDTTGAGDCFTAAFFVKYNEIICKNFLNFYHVLEIFL